MVISELHKLYLTSEGVSTDSRTDLSGKIFFALKGENFNGNLFARKAIENGAHYAVVDEDSDQSQNRIIRVGNVLETLQKLARFHRDYLGIPILGITGSNGKTTNKELLSNVLGQKYNLFATRGNFNNHIGVPLTLLEITQKHEFAIVEMGANKLGDIAELCEIANPDFGFITNIGIAHLEGFKSQENIKIGKGELFEFIKKKKGRLYVNFKEEEVVELADDYERTVFVDDNVGANAKYEMIRAVPSIIAKVSVGGKATLVESSLYGLHNYENVKMAIGIGLDFNIPMENIKKAILDYLPQNNRSEVIAIGQARLYMDAYNANPTSMEASIGAFVRNESGDKIIILGDMLELGGKADYWHKHILELISDSKWQKAIFIGPNFNKARNEGRKDFYFYANTGEANEQLTIDTGEKIAILVKGSRGQKLEELDVIKRLLGNQKVRH